MYNTSDLKWVTVTTTEPKTFKFIFSFSFPMGIFKKVFFTDKKTIDVICLRNNNTLFKNGIGKKFYF